MELTQKDFNERVARKRKGEATDEDLRLIKLYVSEGYEPDADVPTGPEQPGSDDVNDPAPAATTPRKAARARANGSNSR
jgi:hypothetical protein